MSLQPPSPHETGRRDLSVLVTGATGFVGRRLTARLAVSGHRVGAVAIDHQELPGAAERFAVDIRDLSGLETAIARFAPDRIVHLAALQVPFCRANPVLGAQVNVVGTVNIFEGARYAGIKHLAYASSVAVYGPPSDYPPGLVANWRPIETAPKRTDVLAGWADRPHWLPQVLQQDDAGMWFNGEESDYRPPTHWMPLPASPQAETKGDE